MSPCAAAFGLALGLVLGPTGGGAEREPEAGSDEERAELRQRVAAERAACDALAAERKALLGTIDGLERLAWMSSRRAVASEAALARLHRQLEALRAEEAVVQVALESQRRHLSTRLVALYRLLKRDATGALWSAKDFPTLLRGRRAMRALVERDVQSLSDLTVMATAHRRQRWRLERAEEGARRVAQVLRRDVAVARARLGATRDAIAGVTAEQGRRRLLLAELAAADAELAEMVGGLAPGSRRSHFGALKGTLPLPARGIIGAGFGKVVNPRFNTVTVQKGLEILAEPETPVVAVAAGAVVYAGWLKGYGSLLIVDHGGGFHSLYAHLGATLAAVGQDVAAGSVIATVGEGGGLSGPSLYFELRRQGRAVDPLPWLAPEPDDAG